MLEVSKPYCRTLPLNICSALFTMDILEHCVKRLRRRDLPSANLDHAMIIIGGDSAQMGIAELYGWRLVALGPIPLNILKLKVTYHPLCSMNKFVTNKSKLPQDGGQVFPYMGCLAIM